MLFCAPSYIKKKKKKKKGKDFKNHNGITTWKQRKLYFLNLYNICAIFQQEAELWKQWKLYFWICIIFVRYSSRRRHSQCHWTWGGASAASSHCGSSCRTPPPQGWGPPAQLAMTQTPFPSYGTRHLHSGSWCWPNQLHGGTGKQKNIPTHKEKENKKNFVQWIVWNIKIVMKLIKTWTP